MKSIAWNAFCIAIVLFSTPRFGRSQSLAGHTNPVIKKIGITGSNKISERYVVDQLRSQKNNSFDRSTFDDDLRQIVRLYSLKNLYLIRIDSVRYEFSADSSEIRIRIFIVENKEITIGNIIFTGNASLGSYDLQNVMNSDIGKIFEPRMLESDVEAILRLYEDRGFPFARVMVTELRLYEDKDLPKLSMVLTVEENRKTILTQLNMTGRLQTQKNILQREMRLPMPRIFRKSELEAGLARIRRFPFIADAQEGELIANRDSSYSMQIFITEGPSNIIDGVAGYVPQSASSKGYFTGFVNLSFQNLMGTARRLDVRWQKKDRYSQDFLLVYTEPWIFDLPVNIGGSIQQFVQDTTYVERQFTLDGNAWIGAYGAGLFGIKFKYIDPADAVTGYLYNIPTSGFKSVYIGMSYDTRDNPYNPRKGLFYKALIEYGSKNEDRLVENGAASDTLFINGQPIVVEKRSRTIATQKVTLDFETIFSVTRQFVMYNAVHGTVYKSPQALVPYSEQIRFGGLKTVRGYPEDLFNGTRVGWNNFELRWLTSPRSRVFTFVDLGYYYRNASAPEGQSRITKQDGWPLGYGFGIRFETKLGLFALDFGLGKKDSFANGKIHFGIAGQF